MSKDAINPKVSIRIYETRHGITVYINDYRVAGIDISGMAAKLKEVTTDERTMLKALGLRSDVESVCKEHAPSLDYLKKIGD